MSALRPMLHAIRARYSCRTYRTQPIAPQAQVALGAVAAASTVGPLGTTARFEVIAAVEGDPRALRGLGTYGFITNPTGFILGAAAAGPYALEDYGYLMEGLVLRATSLGLGSCWLGGSFTRSRFAARLALGHDELMPAVVAIGYPDGARRNQDRLIRTVAAGDRRLPWSHLFFDGGWSTSLAPEAVGPYAEPLELLRIAPSASNKQPWRIVRTPGAWHFYLQRTPNYPPAVGRLLLRIADLQRSDMGIAMCHWAIGTSELGLAGQWLVEDPGVPTPDDLTSYTVTWMEADGAD